METKPLQQFFHMVVFVLYVVLTFEPVAVADPGEGPWGPELPPYFSTKMRPEGPKKKFVETGPLLSQDLDDPSPHLKVWICHLQWMKPLQQHFYTAAGLYVVLSREPVDEILYGVTIRMKPCFQLYFHTVLFILACVASVSSRRSSRKLGQDQKN